ncbi:TIGR01777 family oxidoreductase [Macrococcoides caseolyticum]|uniref:TIGR01777 family oxidoreductase n=1 Tax=Macrococcoides caseolyticum TaxID=69966 RepID=UPI001F37C86F|nr:TIGR01777 family oxidoreductase [Macrococcus caseolyticus]MCE4956568.1 TIGR01777 family oxidoreductase [Macrococcus caseolyticus]
MNILITGGTGLVGTALTKKILSTYSNAHIYITTRKDQQNTDYITYINWSEDEWYKSIPPLDLVINLAGASLNNRWTEQHKEAIIKSRVESTEKLISLFKLQPNKPFFISASAVGYYPPSQSLIYDEKNTFQPFDFLSKTVYLWEQAAYKITQLGIPTAICRFGVIFSNQGGALPLMMKPYQFMVGGKIGNGYQPYSWIHIDDLVDSILFIYDQQTTGVFNLTAPNPVIQDQLGKTIASVTHKPHWTHTPAKAMNLILGEQSTMITHGQHVLPTHLIQQNYTFKYPTIKSALEDLYGQ